MRYYKYQKNNDSWVLPVFADSVMEKDPQKCFEWDKEIHFICEVSEKEYAEQFKPKREPVQLSFDF